MTQVLQLGAMTAEDIARFYAKVSFEPNGCWLWTGALDTYGYGAFKFAGGARKAHRVAWALDGRSLPGHMTLDHTCRTRACVNPEHIEMVSLRENGIRARIDQLGDLEDEG